MKDSGVIGIIFVDHAESREINRRFLGHDYPTDVIAFPYDDAEDETRGEIYVNVERAREQSVEYGVAYENEIARLIIHGMLHLAGYDDQNPASRSKMREKEDKLVEQVASLLADTSKDA